MTLANLIASGSGKLSARWTFEGLPLEPVTDPGMELTIGSGNSTGVVRRNVTSLEECGFSIDQSVNIPEAMLESQSTTLNLWETVDEDLAAVFHNRPSVERFCAITFDASATTITLLSTTGISVGDVIHIGTEAIKVGGISGNDLTGLTRAYWGSIARKHWASDTAGVPELFVTNRPIRFRGRRVTLYLYGDDDPLTGDGTAVWRGVVADEPRLVSDGTRYQLTLDSNIMLFDTKLGVDLEDPVHPRGIYYHSRAGLHFSVIESLSGALSSFFDVYTGFSETQRDFLDSFNTWLTALTSGADSSYRAVDTPDGWTVKVTVGGSTTAIVLLNLVSEQDGRTFGGQEPTRFDNYEGIPTGSRTLSSGDVLYMRWETSPVGASTIPRGYYGVSPMALLHQVSGATTAPFTRIYVGGSVADSWTAATIEFTDFDGTRPITRRSTSDNWIEWQQVLVEVGAVAAWLYNAELPAEISILRELRTAAIPTYAGLGTLSDLMIAITEEALVYGDLGTSPFIVAADVALTEITAVVARAAVFPWQRTKRYIIAQPIDFLEYFAQECRALSCYPITDSSDKIALRPIEIPNPSTGDIVDITEEVISVDGDMVSLSNLARGNQTVNRVVYQTGYDPKEDEWSRNWTANDITAQALDHQDRSLTIEPYSSSDEILDAEQVGVMALPVLSLFGYPHDYWTPKVPWTLFDLRLGTPVTFDASHLPNFTSGSRPITDVVGIVVGRKWSLSEAFGELRVLVPWQNVAGYSPTGRITSATLVTGNQWDLILSATIYAPTELDGITLIKAPVQFFFAGDQIKVIDIDTESPTVHTGEVDLTSDPHTVRVTFDAPFTASGTQELIFDHYDATGVQAGQKEFAAFAGADRLLGAGNANPRTLSA